MSENMTREVVQQLYAAYGSGDQRTIRELMDDDIDWLLHAPVSVFPFAGPRRGKAAALQVLDEVAKAYALERYDPDIVIVEGDRAAVVCDVAFTQRATGRLLRLRIAHFLRFREGKLVELREFMDTFDLVEQALGTWLDVQKPPGA